MSLCRVDVVIVNWNAGDQLLACIASLVEKGMEGVACGKIVVVDNGSTDRSLEGLSRYAHIVTVVSNGCNRGFAAACNQGAAICNSDYILFLNPDTILSERCIGAAVRRMDRECVKVGVLGIRLVDENGCVSRTCARFPTLFTLVAKSLGISNALPRGMGSYIMSEWDHEDDRWVDHVIGAFYLVRNELFKRLHGFDEKFFVYLEDLDFSLRCHQAGSAVLYTAGITAFHKGGGLSERAKARRIFHSLRSRIVYAWKHFGPFEATVVTGTTLLLEPILRILRAACLLSPAGVIETIHGYTLLWRSILNWNVGGKNA
jgi:N-acetylglucosaminyl-diphospho-decaprenol L-rhamnosyltransferase